MGCVVAIDAGTTGVRALAFDEAGTVLAEAYRPLTQYYPRPGWVEHDPAEIWDLVRATLGDVGARLSDAGRSVAALGITNQRETVVAWDRWTGRALHPAIVWQDRRTAARCESLAEDGRLPMVRRATGLVLDPYFSATKLEWLLTQGRLEKSAALALGTVDAWVLFQLTGGVFATDATNASRTLLFDINGRRWSDELCELFGVPVNALPDVRPSCGRLGIVARDVGRPTSQLAPFAGVPVSGMAGDQQAALFGQACFDRGLTKVTYGTGSFVLMNAGPSPPPPPEGLIATLAWDLGDHGPDANRAAGRHPGHRIELGGALPGHPVSRSVTYALEGSTFVSGAAIQWLRDQLGLIAEAADLGPLAESVADSGGLVTVPAFTGLGSPWWDPRARGTVVGITRGTGKAQLARSVVEAIAFGVRDMVDAMTNATGRPCAELRVDGGASAMGLLLQLQADQLQIPVVRPRCTESTALGAAMLAGLAEGVWSSLDELSSLWQPDAVHHPAVGREAADAAYGTWLRAVERSRRWALE